MTIYATPYKTETKKPTGHSVDSGFESLEQVVEVMGEPVITHGSLYIYGDDEDRVLFSRVPFYLGEIDVRN